MALCVLYGLPAYRIYLLNIISQNERVYIQVQRLREDLKASEWNRLQDEEEAMLNAGRIGRASATAEETVAVDDDLHG